MIENTENPHSIKSKENIFDFAFVLMTCAAYLAIPRGPGQIQIAHIYKITAQYPGLQGDLAPVKESLIDLQHGNILPYLFIALMSLIYVYSKQTKKYIRAIALILALIFVGFNFVFQRLS